MSDLANPGQQVGNIYVIGILTVTGSSLTIAAVPATFIWWWFFRPLKVPRFRHVLVWSYLTSEFIRAITMLIYSSIYLKSNPYLAMVHHSAFCDVIGTFNMMFLEYSDFAVFLLAFHTALIIVSPKCCQGGGLYRFRYYAAVFYFVTPCVFAVICLIPMSSEVRSAYTYLAPWCYFRYFPEWYRFAFSWGPRLFITGAIILIYFVIYYYVKRDLKALDKSISSLGSVDTSPEDRAQHGHHLKCYKLRTSFALSLRKWLSQFPGLNFLYPYGITAVINVDRQASEPTVITLAGDERALETDAGELQNFVNSESYIRFQRRRSDIERQVTFIFVYPAVYIFIYSFQITQQFLYYNQNDTSLLTKEVISYISDFIRPAAGAINSLVFYWKESQSQQLLDRVDRPAYPLDFGEQDRIAPDHVLNIQIATREDYSSPRSDMLSPLDTSRGGWPTSSPPSPQNSSQWSTRMRNFKFRPYTEKVKAVDDTAEVKRSKTVMPIPEESTHRYSHEQSDRESVEEFDLMEFLRQ